MSVIGWWLHRYRHAVWWVLCIAYVAYVVWVADSGRLVPWW